jgi:hypothetical protein
MENNIPQPVIKASKQREALGNGHLERIGKWNGKDVFSFVFDETITVGLPEYYLWDGKRVKVVAGVDALKIEI